jgi:hypothetical protein
LAVRNALRKFAMSAAAIAVVSGFFVVVTSDGPASSAPPAQTAGDDTSAYQTNWSWTYAEVYTLDEPGTGFFSINETDTYTVQGIVQHAGYTCPASYQGGVCNASTPGAVQGPAYTTYQIGINGTVTGGSGEADSESVTVKSGSVTGTEWLETGNLAEVEEDQTQSISGSVSVDSLSLSLQENEVYTPAEVFQDFRLHNSDQWLENSNVYENGLVTYDASGIVSESGNAPIDSYGPVNATATDTSTTVSDASVSSSAIPVDSINYNDTADQTSETRTWSNTFHNYVTDSYLTGLPQGTACTSSAAATCISLTATLTAASTPAPSVTLSESIGGTTNGLACGGESIPVTGTLSSGASGVPVTLGVDESTITPDHIITTTATTGTGGVYSGHVIAPNVPDGLNKPGVNGTFAVGVATSTAYNAQVLEVSPQDCTTTTEGGATSADAGSTAAVTATVTDIATGLPVSGASVTFSLSGESGTVSGTTGSNGVATANLPVNVAPSATPYTVTASYAGSTSEAASSGTGSLTSLVDPTSTSLVASEPTATISDTVTFTATVAPTGPSFGSLTGTVTFTADGNPIGTEPVALGSNGQATSPGLNTLGLGLGTHNIVATYSGNADYAGSSGSIPKYLVHEPLIDTTTSLNVSPSGGGSNYGQSVTLTATVSPQVDNTDSAVTFYDGTTAIATADLSGTSPDTASITTSSLAVGSHSLTAQYNGDGDLTYNGSTSNPVAFQVSSDPTTTAISLVTPSTTPYAFQPLTYSVTVNATPGDAFVPTGTVQVTVNGSNLGGPLTLGSGTATVNVPGGLPAGSNSVVANYTPANNDFAASGSTLPQTVNQATTTTALVSSTGNTGSVLNESVTFTANVTPEGTGNPTGFVNFFDCPDANPCSNSIGESTLQATGSAGSQATLQLSNLPEGSNYITASYAGDGNFTGSQSTPPFNQVVSPPPPTASTSTSVVGTTTPPAANDSSVYGQMVTFTATVSVAGSQGAFDGPTGTVQFSVDGTKLGGPVTLSAASGDATDGWTATASVTTTSPLAAGGHAVIATYSGLSGAGIPQAFAGSGAIVTQEVTQANTTVSGSPSANPAAFGQSETFTATTAAVAPGAGVPGGAVQFKLDGTALGSPVNFSSSGSATSPTATGLQPGTHTVSLVTSGNANYLGSSSSFSFVVSVIPTTTTLTAAPNPVIFGSPLTLTATVSHSTGTGTPTGTVTFFDGTTVLATEGVAPSTGGSAQASFTTNQLAAGAHAIKAVYSGSALFGGSTSSGTVTVTVSKQATKVVAASATLNYNLANLLTPNGVVSLGPLFATLTTTSGAPIPGQTIVFSAVASPGGPVVCSGVTNTNGVASCAPTAGGTLEVELTGGFTATYAGNASYLTSRGSAGLATVIL